MNIRSFDIKTGEIHCWCSSTTRRGGGRGKSLPALGSGVTDGGGREIFHGDIVEVLGAFFLTKFRKGGFWMEYLEGVDNGDLVRSDEGCRGGWLHDFCTKQDNEEGKMSVVGNSRHNSAWLVEVFSRRRAGKEIAGAGKAERVSSIDRDPH